MSSEDQEDDCILAAPIALRTVMSVAQGLPLVVEVVAARGQELALELVRPMCNLVHTLVLMVNLFQNYLSVQFGQLVRSLCPLLFALCDPRHWYQDHLEQARASTVQEFLCVKYLKTSIFYDKPHKEDER